MRFRIHSTLGLTVTMAVVVVGACGDTAIACSGGGCCEGSWTKRLCGGTTTCPSPGTFSYNEYPRDNIEDTIEACSWYGVNYLLVTAKGFPRDSEGTELEYPYFDASVNLSGIEYEETFRYLRRPDRLCWNAPRTQFKLSGTRKIRIYTQGCPYNGFMIPGEPTASVDGSASLVITKSASSVQCEDPGPGPTGANVYISKTEGGTAPPWTVKIVWPPEISIPLNWDDDRWEQPSQTKQCEFLCYLKNFVPGSTSPCVPEVSVTVATRMGANAHAQTGDGWWGWGAQLDIEMFIDNWYFGVFEP